MLQKVRKFAQGWIAWVIVIGLSIPFALFGIDQFSYGSGADRVIATLGKHEITVADYLNQLRQQQNRLQQQLAEDYDRIDQDRLRQQVLSQVLGTGGAYASAKAKGFVVNDEVIRQVVTNNPQFQTDSRFDADKYRQFLAINGLTAKTYELSLLDQIILNQFYEGYIASNFVTDYELQQFYQMNNHERQFAFIVVPWQNAQDQVDISEQEIAEIYDTQQQQFTQPVQLKAQYVSLQLGESQRVEVSLEQLQDFYNERIASYSQPERRVVRHILFDEADLDLARQIRLDILAGKDFAELARTYSKDTVSAANGGSLGEITRGLMVETFDQTAFELAEGEVSDLIATEFGYHIIEVTEIKPNQVSSFAEIRSQLEADYQQDRRNQAFFDRQQQLAELAFEQSDELEGIASQLNLQLQQTDWFSASLGTSSSVTANPKFREEAFRLNALNSDQNSRLIEISDSQVVVLRIVDKKDSFVQPLTEVSNIIRQQLTQQKSLERLEQQNEAAIKALNAGSETWQQYVNSSNYDRQRSQPELLWLGPQSIDEATSESRLELVYEVFQQPRVRAYRYPQGLYTLSATSEGDLMIIYQNNSRNTEVTDEQLQASQSAQVLARFYEQNANAKISEVLNERYPVPQVNLDELMESLQVSGY